MCLCLCLCLLGRQHFLLELSSLLRGQLVAVVLAVLSGALVDLI